MVTEKPDKNVELAPSRVDAPTLCEGQHAHK